MLEQLASVVWNWVLPAFIIALLQDGTDTFAGRITVEHTRSGGIINREDQLFCSTFFKLWEGQLAVRVPFPNSIFAEQACQWVSNFTELGDVPMADVDAAKKML